MQVHNHTIDPAWIVVSLPEELRREIKNFTSLFQMQDEFPTDDLETFAEQVCLVRGSFGVLPSNDWKTRACWVNTLLDLGVHIPNPPRTDILGGYTVYQCAVYAHDIPLIRRLSRLGYDINLVDNCTRTAIYECVNERPIDFSLGVLRALCEEGANVNFDMEQFRHSSILYCFFLSASELSTPTDIPIYIEGFRLLLKHGAVLSGALNAVAQFKSLLPFFDVLIEVGADIEECYYNTPLVTAAQSKNLDCVKSLIDRGANVNGYPNARPVFYAIHSVLGEKFDKPAAVSILKALCDAGADIKILNDRNHNVLSFALTDICACRNMNAQDVAPMVEHLCKYGLDVNRRHISVKADGWKDGDTPLHFAACLHIRHLGHLERTEDRAENAYSECTEVLISYGANVDSQNNEGATPLHYAVKSSNYSCARVLVKHGARIDLQDFKGGTSLMLAERTASWCKGIYDLLIMAARSTVPIPGSSEVDV